MPIEIRNAAEPLSRASLSRDFFAPAQFVRTLAESSAAAVLEQQLDLYCRGRINGRSFLIAGHRGAGKTTLVASAFMTVRSRAEDDRETGLARPLLVPLNGTTLLPDPELPRHPARPWWVSADDEESKPPASTGAKDEARNALEQITLCLFRALAKEVALSFRPAVVTERPGGRYRRLDLQRLEVAAQLESEIFDCPEPDRLCQLWRLGGLFDDDAERSLFWRRPSGFQPLFRRLLYRSPTSDLDVRSQVLRELVAVAAAADAYRRISGKVEQEDKRREATEETKEVAAGLHATGKELLNFLMVLAAGGLAGTGALAAEAGTVPSVLTGLATALAASAFFKIGYSRQRRRASTRELTFLPDRTLETLDRTLPILIDRLLDARIAPVFVVDELDKVKNLPERMGGLVRHLKTLLAEQAFFCFLTDRLYFEETQPRRAESGYPVAYSYFTYCLYVVFSAAALHRYLASVLISPASLSARPDPDEVLDYAFLPYILLYRSKMHMLDLRREIALLSDDQGRVALPPGSVRTSVPFRLAVLTQVAVEIVLASKELVDWVEQSPPALRLVYDALYYPARQWEDGQDVRLQDADLEAFERYLLCRADLRVDRDVRRRALSDKQLEILFDSARQVALLLSDWASFAVALDKFNGDFPKSRVDTPVVENLRQLRQAKPGEEERRPPFERVKSRFHFKWRYTPLDEPRASRAERVERAAAAAPPVQQPDWQEDASLIGEIDAFLAELSAMDGPSPIPTAAATGLQSDEPVVRSRIDLTTLSSDLRILSSSPAWPEVQRAITNLRRVEQERSSYGGATADITAVHEFAEMLRGSANRLALALAWGARVGRASRTLNKAARLRAGLEAMSSAYQFDTKLEPEVNRVLASLTSKAVPGLLLPALEPPPPFVDAASVAVWKATVKQLIDEAEKLESDFNDDTLASWRAAAWETWRSRLAAYFTAKYFNRASEVLEPQLTELFCAAADVGPTKLLRFKLESMTLAAWSNAALTALTVARAGDPLQAPPWLGTFALWALGFDAPQDLSAVIAEFTEVSQQLTISEASPPASPPSDRPRLSMFILQRAKDSIVGAWLPSPAPASYVALTVTDEQVGESALANTCRRLSKALKPDWLVIEESIAENLSQPLRASSPRGPVALTAKVPATARRGATIVGAKNLEEIATYLRSLPPEVS
jgi:hypothetical protein